MVTEEDLSTGEIEVYYPTVMKYPDWADSETRQTMDRMFKQDEDAAKWAIVTATLRGFVCVEWREWSSSATWKSGELFVFKRGLLDKTE